jgi:hypothetical protein
VIELEQRLQLAEEVLAAFDRLPRATAAALSRALMLLPGPMRGLGDAIDAHLNGSPELARLQVAFQVRKLALDADLLERLEGAPEPWASLRSAIETLRADGLEGMLPAPGDG